MSAPPQAPVSMHPPSTPWAPPQQAPAPVSATPQQQAAFPPPVISRDKQKQPKAPKAPAPADGRSLKSYVVLGLVITVVLGIVMTSWLWFINRPGAADDTEEPEALDLAQIDGDGAPVNVAIESWANGQVTLTWESPVENAQLEYVILSRRVGDDMAEPLNTTTENSYTASGLNPAVDYCFIVGAVWAHNELPTADPVCTNDE
jgi:serine/threonine-protein kinase PknK